MTTQHWLRIGLLLIGSVNICLVSGGTGRAELVAYFPFDEDAIDVVSGFEGFVQDGVAFDADAGVLGGAAEFDGFGGIIVDHDEALNPEDAFTVSAWVYPYDNAGWNSVITSRSHVAAPEGTYIAGYIIYNSPSNEWDFWTGGGGAPGTWGRNIGPFGTLDEWQHLAITYDGELDEKTLYVNGEVEAVVDGQGYAPNPNMTLNIGAGGDLGAEFFFTGLIDELTIWNVALDEADIQRLMTEGVGGVGGGGGTAGDVNGDGMLDALDIDAITAAVRQGDGADAFDVNGDGDVDQSDRTHWVEELKKTYFGDSNLDGEFSSSDFVVVFQAGQYEDATVGNSTWETGDWNGDGDFDSSDFVAAFQAGGYEQGPRAAVAAVPEPGSFLLTLGAIVGGVLLRRRQTHV